MKRTSKALKPQIGTEERENLPCTEARAHAPECAFVRNALDKAKDRLINDYSAKMDEDGKLLSLAVTEAEALAWQTGYPQLLFPTLAIEKAEAAVQWHRRQQRVRRKSIELAFAA